MALVVEDGTGKADANSYSTVEYYRIYAKRHGVNLTGSVSDLEVNLTCGWDFMLGQDYKGRRATEVQAGDFPRVDLKIDGVCYSGNRTLSLARDAQCALALESRSTDLLPTIAANASGGMIEQTIGPITKRWEGSGRASTRPIVEKAKVFLRPLLRSGGNTIALSRG